MSVSSGTLSLFSSAAFAIAGASAAAYALQNPTEARAIIQSIFEQSGAEAVVPVSVATASRDDDAVAPSAGNDGDVALRATGNGHFESEAEVNGRSIEVMVDTGATLVALTYEDAERAGIFLRPADFTHQVSTANGIAKIAPVTLAEVSIGPITVRNVKAAVCERGKLEQTLLGMSFLSRLSRVDMRAGTLVLHE